MPGTPVMPPQEPTPGSAPAPAGAFALYGLRVRSDLDLPGWPSLDDDTHPDLTIRRRPLSGPEVVGPTYSVKSLIQNGELHLAVRGVARYLVTGGSVVHVDPDPAAKSEDVQLYLTGVVLAAVLHQRRVIPLHASCVAIAGEGLALAGPSGAGKSTLIAKLVGRGAAFVSDDICVLAPLAGGRFGVWPSLPRTKLDQAALAALNGEQQGLESAGGNRGKFLVPLGPPDPGTAPVPLRRVYLLRDAEHSPRIELLEGLEAVAALVDETYYLGHAVGLGLASECFRAAATLAHKVQVGRLLRPRGFQHLDQVVDLLEAEARRA